MKRKFLIMMCASLILFAGCGKKDDKTEENKGGNNVEANEPTPENPTNITNDEMIKDQDVESLKITQVSLVYDGNMTTLTSQVTNNSDQVVRLSQVIAHINYVDEDNDERTLDMGVYFGEKLQPGETRTARGTSDIDLRKSYSVTYEIIR